MKNNLLLIFGISSIGGLIGLLTGITTAEISNTILTGLLAFIGGKIIFEFENKSETFKRFIGWVLIGFVITFIIGFFIGIDIKINKKLSPKIRGNAVIDSNISYLRTINISNNLEDLYRTKQISCEQFIDSLLKTNK